MLRFALLLAFASLVFAQGTGALAQSYPSRTIKFIVPFGPASGTDITARLIGDKLSKRWGQPVVIENRPGGDGFVAINAFISANDDHTLLFIPAGTFAVHPYAHEKLPYDADRDLMPVVNATSLVLSLSAPAAFNTNTLDEFVKRIRAEPGKHNAAAANGNAEFLLNGFLKNYDLQIAKAPYRDIMQGPNDLAENRIQLLSSSLAIVQPLKAAGRIKVLAVTSRVRAPSAPDVPTVAESGYPALQLESLVGVFGPRSMPMETRERIAADFRAVAANDPEVMGKLGATGQIVDIRGPAEFAAGIAELRGKLAAIARTLGMKAAQ